MTGPEALHCFSAASLGARPSSDVALTPSTRDGIVHHQADGRTNPNMEKSIDGEAEERKEKKCAHSETGTASIGIRVARQS